MLILFDIDATLITTSRAGVLALQDAGRELHGPGFSVARTEFAGRLDPLIIADLLRDNGLEVSEAGAARMREGYRRHLARRLREPGVARALPGVPALLAALGAEPGVMLGLLTGNYEDTGCAKLRASGIDPEQFAVRVWGDQCPEAPPCRDQLPAVALRAYARLNGSAPAVRGTVGGAGAVIIGDTPHDVRCALHGGCRALGVATGSYSASDLERAGAHRVVPTLEETGAIVSWLLDGRAG